MAALALSQDIELGHLRDGYPALSSWIARDPDGETLVFRKFNRMSARNLLHLQCQLTGLEREIDQLDDQARRSADREEQQSSRRWETLIEHAKDPNRPEKKRLKKAEELSVMLKEYYEALVLQAQIAALKCPSDRVHSAFSNYVSGRTTKGMPLPIISGRAKDFLRDREDLVALKKPAEEDVLSRLLQDHWVFQRRATTDPLDRTTVFTGHKVVLAVAGISMFVAAVLMVVAIASLYVVSSQTVRLGMIAVYTLLFSISLAFLTNAKRTEIYASTAAYAAVLVVFVSGNLGQSNDPQCFIQISQGIYKTYACPT